MSPLAIAGVVPRTTTKMIVASVWRNSRIAHGTHATDGMVWMPVMSEPNAARSTPTRATRAPIKPDGDVAATRDVGLVALVGEPGAQRHVLRVADRRAGERGAGQVLGGLDVLGHDEGGAAGRRA